MHAIIFATLLVAAADGAGPRVDCFGDPLPDGALARMGTVRLRSAHKVADAVLSADHAMLVTLDDEGEIHVWNTADGVHVREIPDLRASKIALSPDGKTLALADYENTLRLVEVATGKEVRRLVEKQETGFYVLVFSPDGKTLAAGDGGGVRLWEAATGKETARWAGYDNNVLFLSFSADGSRLAVGVFKDGEFTSRVTETATGKILCASVEGLALLSPDGRRAAAAPRKPVVSLWEVDGPRKIRSYGEESKFSYPIAFTPDGKAFWTISNGYRSCLWNADSGEKRADVVGMALCLSADGKVLVLKDPDGGVRLCDGSTGEDLHPEFGHCAQVHAAAFAPNGKTLLTEANDDFLVLWDVKSGKLLCRFPFGPHEHQWRASMTFSLGGRTLAARDGRVRCWEAATGKEQTVPADGSELQDGPSAFSPDGRLLLVGDQQDQPCLWDLRAGKVVRRLPAARGIEVWNALAFSTDGVLAAGARADWVALPPSKQVRYRIAAAVWEVETGRVVCSFDVPYTGLPAYPALCLDARTLVVAAGNTMYFLDVSTSVESQPLPLLASAPLAVALSPDGRLVAGGGDDGVVRLWETATRREVQQWKGHRDWVEALAFSPDGKTLVSGGTDATALLWDVAGQLERREPIRTAEQQAARWADLAGDDAVRARRAVQILAADPERSVPLLKEKLSPVVVDGPRVARLIADLNNDDFEEREKAQNELAKQGRTVLPALRQALAAHPPPESKRRIEELLERRHTFTGEELRDLRAVCALEWAGTTDARTLLEALSKGAAAAVQTDEAAAALRRLERKTQPPPTSETTATAADK